MGIRRQKREREGERNGGRRGRLREGEREKKRGGERRRGREGGKEKGKEKERGIADGWSSQNTQNYQLSRLSYGSWYPNIITTVTSEITDHISP